MPPFSDTGRVFERLDDAIEGHVRPRRDRKNRLSRLGLEDVKA